MTKLKRTVTAVLITVATLTMIFTAYAEKNSVEPEVITINITNTLKGSEAPETPSNASERPWRDSNTPKQPEQPEQPETHITTIEEHVEPSEQVEQGSKKIGRIYAEYDRYKPNGSAKFVINDDGTVTILHQPHLPQTGDDFPILQYALICISSLFCIVFLRKRRT